MVSIRPTPGVSLLDRRSPLVDYVFYPTKPITKIQYFILFRRCTGEAWFDNVSLSLERFAVEDAIAMPSLYGGNSLADKAYVYTFDERPDEFYPIIREYFGLIKKRYGIPTLTTAKVPQDPVASVGRGCTATA